MRLPEYYGAGRPGISIEVFPPKTEEGDQSLYENLGKLMPYSPGFVSVTYGAGGSTRGRTVRICSEIQNRFQVDVTAHLTCVSSTEQELVEWLEMARDAGVQNIMALRGDPPAGQSGFQKVENGFAHANELVSMIRKRFPNFGIGVAGYPEMHPEATNRDLDLAHLKTKVESGADAVFTQLFYVNQSYYRFREQAESLGMSCPIVPGIMPITEFSRIKRIASMCRAAIPSSLSDRLEAVQEDKSAQFEIGVEYAIEQCRDLLQNGVPGIHFYVLNRSQACEAILDALDFSRIAS